MKDQTMRRTVGTIAAVVLGVVLLVAGLAKAIDPQAFVEQIGLEGLDFLISAEAVMYLALAIEIGLGLLLLFGVRRLWVLIPAAGLVIFFLILTGRGYWIDTWGVAEEAHGCGCFGNLVARTPAQAFWQDLLMMGPAALLMFIGRREAREAPTRRVFLAGVGVIAVLILAWRAPGMPLDDLATRLRPGVGMADLCVGAVDDPERLCLDSLLPELDAGDHVVVIAAIEDPVFEAKVERLNGYSQAGTGPRLWVVSSDPAEVQHSFFWSWAPSFEIREAPVSMLRPMYRSLPRTFWVSDGRVARTFSGIPPLDGLIGSADLESMETK